MGSEGRGLAGRRALGRAAARDGDGARRASAARFLPLAVLVVLAMAAGVAYVAARTAVDDQNERLLEQRTDEVAVFLQSAVGTLASSLRPLGVAARLDDEEWTGVHRRGDRGGGARPGRAPCCWPAATATASPPSPEPDPGSRRAPASKASSCARCRRR